MQIVEFMVRLTIILTIIELKKYDFSEMSIGLLSFVKSFYSVNYF